MLSAFTFFAAASSSGAAAISAASGPVKLPLLSKRLMWVPPLSGQSTTHPGSWYVARRLAFQGPCVSSLIRCPLRLTRRSSGTAYGRPLPWSFCPCAVRTKSAASAAGIQRSPRNFRSFTGITRSCSFLYGWRAAHAARSSAVSKAYCRHPLPKRYTRAASGGMLGCCCVLISVSVVAPGRTRRSCVTCAKSRAGPTPQSLAGISQDRNPSQHHDGKDHSEHVCSNVHGLLLARVIGDQPRGADHNGQDAKPEHAGQVDFNAVVHVFSLPCIDG